MPNEPSQYFSKTPQAPSRPEQFAARVRGVTLQLTSDTGTFSHGEIDRGSRLLVEKMDLPETGDVLDLGCGWGLLGLVAAKRGPGLHVVMVDVNPRACELATQNAAANATANAEVLCGDAPEVLGERQFDVVLCNPPIRAGKAEVMRLLGDAAARLRSGGALWIVARTDKGAKTLARDIAGWFAKVEMVLIQGGYRVYVGRKD
jgi:16S rRNA (guanine1207-N2)-methyltransferase